MDSTADSRIIEKFIHSVRKKNRELFESLLDDKGQFDLQDTSQETKAGGKDEFVDWFFGLLELTEISSVNVDSCIFCSPGNTVVIFNEGKFPRKIKGDSEKAKTGLMLEIRNGKIAHIQFCFSFLKTENKAVFEIKLQKVKQLLDIGLTMEDALELISRRNPFEHFDVRNWN